VHAGNRFETETGNERKRRADSEVALFCSGVFAGGAIDHAILAVKRRLHTPYGIRTTSAANWLLAAFDAALALAAYAFYRHRL
jgi:hypothetical protein